MAQRETLPDPEPTARWARRSRIDSLRRARGETWETLAATAGISLARLGAVVNGPTGDPHLLADRLGLTVAAVVGVIAAPPGAPCLLPLDTVLAIRDGAPPTEAECAAVATALAVPVAALDGSTCPRCAVTNAFVFVSVCWNCGWRIHFPKAAPAAAESEGS